MNKYKNIISKFNKKKIMVIGDIMLDRHIQGNVTRISPEAPVPVVLEEKSFYTPGGAANVSNNLRSLGAKVLQIGRTGNDFEGKILKRELKRKGIDLSGIFVDSKAPTITKTRVIALHQQVVRIDREKTNVKIDKKIFDKICELISSEINSYDGIIISDYGKGIVTPELLSFVCSLSLKKKKVITVDPKVEHFAYYRNVTGITPNLKEAENAIRNIKITEKSAQKLAIHSDKLDSDEMINLAGEELLKYLNLESLLITLGERGMRLFEKGKKVVSIATKAREVFDVTGAGDAVISLFTLSLACGASKRLSAELSNIAAGIVVGKLGSVAVTKEELIEGINRN